jgi:hypothetical protein
LFRNTDGGTELAAFRYLLFEHLLRAAAERAMTGPSDARVPWVHVAVDTLAHLLALRVMPANKGDREQVGKLAGDVQTVTGDSIEVAFVG